MESKTTKRFNKKPSLLLELKHHHFVSDLPYPFDEDVVVTYYLCRQVGSSVRIVHSSCDYSEVRAIMDDRKDLHLDQRLFLCKFISSLQRLTL